MLAAGAFNWYGVLALVAIAAAAWTWTRAAGRAGPDRGTMAMVYLAALVGGLVGAKLAYLFAEGWAHRGDWLALVTGRSVTGALLGGYVAVEVAKRILGVRSATGDFFAVAAPLGIAIGRVGCVLQGCCAGVACDRRWWTSIDSAGVTRWPAAHAELAFNVLFLAWALVAQRRGWLTGNRFHVYMVAYGLFRLAHEPMRDIPPLAPGWTGPLTGYQVVAAALVAVGVIRFVQRRRVERAAPAPRAIA